MAQAVSTWVKEVAEALALDWLVCISRCSCRQIIYYPQGLAEPGRGGPSTVAWLQRTIDHQRYQKIKRHGQCTHWSAPWMNFITPTLRALLLDFIPIYYMVCNLLCFPMLNQATVSVTQGPPSPSLWPNTWPWNWTPIPSLGFFSDLGSFQYHTRGIRDCARESGDYTDSQSVPKWQFIFHNDLWYSFVEILLLL